MAALLLDTNVVLDFLLTSRPRHSLAVQLVNYINTYDIRVLVPMTLSFEVAATLKHPEINFKDINPDFSSLKTLPLNIDRDFALNYIDTSLPYVKGADSIFLAIAAKHKFEFITEDVTLYKKSKEAGIDVYTIQEYIDEI